MSHRLSRDIPIASTDLCTATVTLGCSCSNVSSTPHNTFRDNPVHGGFTQSHSPLWSKPAPTWPFPPGEPLFCYGLILGNVPQGVPAWPQIQSSMFQGVPAAAWISPWATISAEVHLLCHRHNHDHRCFDVYLLWLGLIQGHRCFRMSYMDSSMSPRLLGSSSQRSPSLSSTAAEKQQRWSAHLPEQPHHLCSDQNAPSTTQWSNQQYSKQQSWKQQLDSNIQWCKLAPWQAQKSAD